MTPSGNATKLQSTLALRTPPYYGQELKSWQIGTTENNSCHYRLDFLYYGHQMEVLKVSVIKGGSLVPRWPILARAYLGFCSINNKRLGLFLLPPEWDASPSHGTSQHCVTGTHLYTWVERGTVRVKCLAQEHNTMTPARPRAWTAQSGVWCTNH